MCVRIFLQTTFISLLSVHTLTNLHIFKVPRLHEGSEIYIAKLLSLKDLSDVSKYLLFFGIEFTKFLERF